MLKIEWRGSAKVEAAIAKAIAEQKRKCAAALYQEAEMVMADSKENYVPVDTGQLRSSGFVRQPLITKDNVTINMGFSAEHAKIVHEDLTARHPVGEAKYLTKPLLKRSRGLAGRIAERMKR